MKSDAILLIFRMACRHPAKLQRICLKAPNMWISHFTSVFFQLKQYTNLPASPPPLLFMLSPSRLMCALCLFLFSLSVRFPDGLNRRVFRADFGILLWHGSWTLILVAGWIERIRAGITGMEPDICWS